MRCASSRAIAGCGLRSRRSPAGSPRTIRARATAGAGRSRARRSARRQQSSAESGGQRANERGSGEVDEGGRVQRGGALRALVRAPPRRAREHRRQLELQRRSSGGPRRFRMRSASRSAPPACSARRSGDARRPLRARPPRAARRPAPSCACAASCSRRSRSARSRGGSQASTAPTWPLFSACSSAHRLSLPGDHAVARRVDDEQLLDVEAERGERRSAESTAGGSNSITSRPARCAAASAGASRRISPTPGCGSSSSVSTRRGQPPPGSCGIERGEAARHGALAAAAELMAEPQRRMQRFGRAAAAGAATPARPEPQATGPRPRRPGQARQASDGTGRARGVHANNCTFIQYSSQARPDRRPAAANDGASPEVAFRPAINRVASRQSFG